MYLVTIIIPLTWFVIGVLSFIHLHRKLCITKFTYEDVPAAIFFGGVTGPFGLLVILVSWIIERSSSKE